MFVRLESPLPQLPRWPGTALRYRFGKTVDGRFHGISYFIVDGEIEAALLALLPDALQPRFICSYMVANHHDIPPHIDNGIQVSINCYVVTADATTSFYRFRQPRPAVEHLDNNDAGTAAGLYRREDLDVVASFHAQPQELWVLDVTQPHDVVSAPGQGAREAYCLQSRTVGFAQLLAFAQRSVGAKGAEGAEGALD